MGHGILAVAGGTGGRGTWGLEGSADAGDVVVRQAVIFQVAVGYIE